MTGRAHGESGFSLLEAIVALAIVAVAIPVALSLFRTTFEASSHTERKIVALLAAESKLAELGAPVLLRPGRTQGQLRDGLRWVSVISAYRGLPHAVLEVAPVEAFEIDVTVSWGDQPADRVRLRTLRLAPRRHDG